MGKLFSLLTILLVLCLFIGTGFAADIKIAWDANSEIDLAGYNVYYGTNARTGTDPKVCTMCGYTQKIPIANKTAVSYTITGLTAGTTYWISLTAYNTSGQESAFSNQVSGPAKDYTAIASITVSPPTASIAVGGTQQFTAVARDGNGNIMSPQPVFSWSSSNTTVATVSSTGLVTGVKAGSVIITATNSSISGSGTVTVVATPPAMPTLRIVP